MKPPSKSANESQSSLVILSGSEDEEDDFFDAEDSKSNSKPAHFSPIASGSADYLKSSLPKSGTTDGSLIFDASDEDIDDKDKSNR